MDNWGTNSSSLQSMMEPEQINEVKLLVVADIRSSTRFQELLSGDVNELRKAIINSIRKYRSFNSPEIEERIISLVNYELKGHGPIQPLLDDPNVTEVMVNRHDLIYCEKKGVIHKTDIKFDSKEHLRTIIRLIVQKVGRTIDDSNPIEDARLPDGSRVNVTIEPISVFGDTLTIRKHNTFKMKPEDLIRIKSIPEFGMIFLEATVKARINEVVSGGTGTGKTTILNLLSNFIPENERIVVIEDTKELDLAMEHVIYLEKRPANSEGKGEVTIRHLVANALRMRPTRVVVGECRREEALEMLQAMNTGHDGSMTTGHANTPRDILSRLEYMATLEKDISERSLRAQIVAAIDLIIQIVRDSSGHRRVAEITELCGIDKNGEYILKPIFKSQYPLKRDQTDELHFTGYIPTFADRLDLPENYWKDLIEKNKAEAYGNEITLKIEEETNIIEPIDILASKPKDETFQSIIPKFESFKGA